MRAIGRNVCYRTSRVGPWSVPGAADGCVQFRGGLIGSRGGTIGRTGGCLGPFMRRLTPQVVAQAGRPHCHLSGPAAQERVKATNKRAHAHTSLPPLRGQRAGTTGNASPHQKAKKSCYRTSRVGRWSVPGAADGCAQFRGGLIGPRGGTIGRTGGCLGPFMRRLTPQVVAQAGRPHCHLSGPAAQERVKATNKRAHAHTSLPPLRGQRAGTTGNASPHQIAKESPFQQHVVSYNPSIHRNEANTTN